MSEPRAAVPLTWLYVPGDRPERIEKALASAADVVILDLEDAVSPGAKDAARRTVSEFARAADRPLQIRVNAVDTPWHAADLAMLGTLPAAVGLRLPKCEDPATVAECVAAAGVVGVAAAGVAADGAAGRELHLLVESALGIERAFDLATCSPAVASIGLGEADLRADLAVVGDAGLGYARGRVVNAAAAAGLPSPSMSVYPNLRDLTGLAESCRQGRELGFLGRTAIHPAQLPVIRLAFTPTDDEVSAAREVVAAAEQGEQLGRGALALPDGRFVDAAVVRRARAILSIARP
ncbi:HpcH/HpaI aldolase/citrate lyase family protein [Nakamurella lactea]|uniref:HpcH/HpaI aldolase/citrate lyase family protein n=1 Tax=Nakamurella lactea TaxID=459515 RepID=UPI000491CBBA|nr:CoA ester lyase [Nakamurella lactea]